jgi:hypothetical protein
VLLVGKKFAHVKIRDKDDPLTKVRPAAQSGRRGTAQDSVVVNTNVELLQLSSASPDPAFERVSSAWAASW